jgi:hypothetical protein
MMMQRLMLMTRKTATRILTMCPSLMLIPMKRETMMPVTETRNQRQSIRKGWRLDTAGEAAVQEVMVGSLYRDKATVVAEELDLLYGVETTDTIMQEEDEDRGDVLVLDEMHTAGYYDDEDALNGDHAGESDWI